MWSILEKVYAQSAPDDEVDPHIEGPSQILLPQYHPPFHVMSRSNTGSMTTEVLDNNERERAPSFLDKCMSKVCKTGGSNSKERQVR